MSATTVPFHEMPALVINVLAGKRETSTALAERSSHGDHFSDVVGGREDVQDVKGRVAGVSLR